ncbi:MAG TPA: hypothetical protein VE907_06530 [Gammaproteobacteria bacterium]|nr:hypothetical protein [Gammaproteobacteria bacterium]
MSARRALLAAVGALALLVAGALVAQQIEQQRGRFATVDVYVDSPEPLAAWQFELGERRGTMQVVGIEGGENASFGDPPYYDRAAVERAAADRIIVADFSLSPPESLPVGRTRVATVHVRLTGGAAPDYDARLVAAGAADGRPIDAKISLDMRNGR